MKKYDTVVYIGRFRPPHRAHIQTMLRALEEGEQLLILCGSANQARTTKNPWSIAEIHEMIMAALPSEVHSRVIVYPLKDSSYNDQEWAMEVQKAVGVTASHDGEVAIIGHNKDESSSYLNMFPQYTTIEMSNIDGINATDIRDQYFYSNGDMEEFADAVGDQLPQSTIDYLSAFALTSDYQSLVREYEFLLRHAKMWESAPYPPIFVTVDAVVIQSGHILLVRRRAEPGKNLFAIAGGYLDAHEYIIPATIRELKEETGIKVPVPVLKGSIKKTKVYDAPNRSLRGRIITHASLIELPNGELPKVRGSDETDKVQWVPLSVFHKMEPQMFEDHFQIITDLIG